MFKVINNIPSLVIEISSSSIIHRWDTVTKLNSRNLIENKWRRSSVRWIAWVKQICEWVIDGCDIVGEEKRSERYGIGIVESFYEWVFFLLLFVYVSILGGSTGSDLKLTVTHTLFHLHLRLVSYYLSTFTFIRLTIGLYCYCCLIFYFFDKIIAKIINI